MCDGNRTRGVRRLLAVLLAVLLAGCGDAGAAGDSGRDPGGSEDDSALVDVSADADVPAPEIPASEVPAGDLPGDDDDALSVQDMPAPRDVMDAEEAVTEDDAAPADAVTPADADDALPENAVADGVAPDAAPDATDAALPADADAAAADAASWPDAVPDVDAAIPFPELEPATCRLPDSPDLRGFDPGFALPAGMPGLLDKAWFLLSVLQAVPAASDAVAADPALQALSLARDAGFREAASTCGDDAACHAARLVFSAGDAAAVAQDLARVLVPTGVVASHLRPSGRFALHADLADDALVIVAASEALSTLGTAFNDHGLRRADLPDRMVALAAANPGPLPFWRPLVDVVLDVVAADGRDEATRYEPLDAGENAAALARLATLDWDDWRFSAILVPGWGPDDLETPLSALGHDHCDIAVQRWQAGVAPFLLLSGGHVHPDRTPYSEAIEMKRYLREAYQVPGDAILVDPYARHTTTNLRNAARLLLGAGVPPERPVLVSTDALQLLYISALDDRCNKELGYVPYRIVRLLSEEDGCFLPDALAMHADARDLLDP